MTGLDKLFPKPVNVEVAGKLVPIRELTIGQLPRFLRAAAPVLDSLMRQDGAEVGELLEHVDTVVNLVVIATGIERETLEALPATDLIMLLEAMLEVNGRFFGEALPAFVSKLAAKGAAAMDGLTPLSSSSSTDTRGARSSATP